jgi:hypothetical protein
LNYKHLLHYSQLENQRNLIVSTWRYSTSTFTKEIRRLCIYCVRTSPAPKKFEL